MTCITCTFPSPLHYLTPKSPSVPWSGEAALRRLLASRAIGGYSLTSGDLAPGSLTVFQSSRVARPQDASKAPHVEPLPTSARPMSMRTLDLTPGNTVWTEWFMFAKTCFLLLLGGVAKDASSSARPHLGAKKQRMLRPFSEVADIEARLGPVGRHVDPVFQHSQGHYVGFVRDLV